MSGSANPLALPKLADDFDPTDILGAPKVRRRKFNPANFFFSVVHLISGKNFEGYHHALWKTWAAFSSLNEAPTKGSFAKIRARISFKFFQRIFKRQIESFESHRPTWKGLHVYACDGDQYEIPATKDILSHTYRGRSIKGGLETYYPRMYIVHAYDVLGGVTKDFRYSHLSHEVKMSLTMAADFEPNSLTLYDRLYSVSTELVRTHKQAGSYFLTRCRAGIGFGAVLDFFKSTERWTSFHVDGVEVFLVRVRNSKKQTDDIYATNLPKKMWSIGEIRRLYQLRWQVEVSFRDFTCTMKAEQWHSKKLNGILQEIFASLWIMNYTKIQLALHAKAVSLDDLPEDYEKSNFKLTLDFLVSQLKNLACGTYAIVEAGFKLLFDRSLERRKRWRRGYPREVRGSRSLYPCASVIRARHLKKLSKEEAQSFILENFKKPSKTLSNHLEELLQCG